MDETADQVKRIVGELRDGWWTVFDLRTYRHAWLELEPSLERYPGIRFVLREIYEHAMLAGCRRLVDQTKGTTSVWRALNRLHSIAPEVTAEVLVQTRRGDNPALRDAPPLEIARTNLAKINGTHRHADRLLKSAVHADKQTLANRHRDVIQLANELTAHAADGGTTGTVSDVQINGMLDHVYEVTRRWIELLEGVSLSSPTRPHPGDTRAMARALDLFDWRAYQLAREEHDLRAGPRAVNERQTSDEDTVQVRYVWPDD